MVAIKHIGVDNLRTSSYLGALEGMDVTSAINNEINLLRTQQNNPLVASYLAHFLDGHEAFIVTELCDRDLFELVSTDGPVSEAKAKSFAVQMLLALHHVHAAGIGHRDIKLENWCLTEAGSLKLIDFGIAVRHQNRTMRNMCGSSYYVAPEVVRGHTDGYRGGSCDVRSVGVALFILLCGYPPFFAECQQQLRRCIVSSPIEKCFAAAPERWGAGSGAGDGDAAMDDGVVSAQAQELLRLLLTKDPDQRVTAAQALQHPWFDEYRQLLVVAVPAVDTASQMKHSECAFGFEQHQPQSQSQQTQQIGQPLALAA